jgi:hypothetical protein
MWAAKKNVNLLDAPKLEQAINNATIDTKLLADVFMKFFKNERLYNKSKSFFLSSDIRFSKCIQKIIEVEQTLKSELKRVANYVSTYLILKAGTDARGVFGKLLLKLKDQPEFNIRQSNEVSECKLIGD